MKYFLILTLNLFLVSNIIAQKEESTKLTTYKSNNIGLRLTVGTEIGLQLRYEFEKKDWGKIITNGQMLVYTPISDNILFDLGLGYGYPISVSDKNAFYANSLLSSGLQLPVKGGYSFCSSGIFEFEYRRNIGNFSFNLLPFSRLMYTYYEEYVPDCSLTLSFGMQLGIMYRF